MGGMRLLAAVIAAVSALAAGGAALADSALVATQQGLVQGSD